jgi:glycosyltransferase involved in cell wall biosynthesis
VTILMANAYGMSGVPRAVFGLADHLAADHEVVVLNLVRRRRDLDGAFQSRVTVVTVDDRTAPLRGWRRVARRLLRRFRSRLMHPADVLASTATLWTDVRLIRALRQVRGGVVLATRPSLSILAAHMSRPGLVAIGQEHRDLTIRPPSLRESMRRSYGTLSAVVVLTDTDRHRWETMLRGATRVVTIPNAVTPLGGPPSDLSQPVVIASGRLTPQKGFDLLIRSFAQQVATAEPAWSLRICGEGRRRDGLEAMVARRNLAGTIHLPGWIPDIASEFERASIFALSSRSEGFPLVLLEAMSKGLPVVAYDCRTGPADIVEDGYCGFLIAPGDVDGFGEALLELIRDEPKRRRFGRAAAERAEAWAGPQVWLRWDRLLDELSRG